MRKIARTDQNQQEIVNALRKVGCSVGITSTLGNGYPDLDIGFRNRNLKLEVKDGSKPPSERQLTPDQQKWHNEWRGQVAVVESIEQALKVIQTDQTLYRIQRAQAIYRETKKVSVCATPMADSYAITVVSQKGTTEMVYPGCDPFALMSFIQKLLNDLGTAT